MFIPVSSDTKITKNRPCLSYSRKKWHAFFLWHNVRHDYTVPCLVFMVSLNTDGRLSRNVAIFCICGLLIVRCVLHGAHFFSYTLVARDVFNSNTSPAFAAVSLTQDNLRPADWLMYIIDESGYALLSMLCIACWSQLWCVEGELSAYFQADYLPLCSQ